MCTEKVLLVTSAQICCQKTLRKLHQGSSIAATGALGWPCRTWCKAGSRRSMVSRVTSLSPKLTLLSACSSRVSGVPTTSHHPSSFTFGKRGAKARNPLPAPERPGPTLRRCSCTSTSWVEASWPGRAGRRLHRTVHRGRRDKAWKSQAAVRRGAIGRLLTEWSHTSGRPLGRIVNLVPREQSSTRSPKKLRQDNKNSWGHCGRRCSRQLGNRPQDVLGGASHWSPCTGTLQM
jgi:hypothetical protein